MSDILKELLECIQTKSKTEPSDDFVEVKKVDGNTVWVTFPGSNTVTPVERTIDCKVGDVVQVRRSSGKAYIQGNASNPPTDDTIANKAEETAKNASEEAADANYNAKNALDKALSSIKLTKEQEKKLTQFFSDFIFNGLIRTDKLNVNEIFAQDISASGTIRGARLLGSHIIGGDEKCEFLFSNGEDVGDITSPYLGLYTNLSGNRGSFIKLIDYENNDHTRYFHILDEVDDNITGEQISMHLIAFQNDGILFQRRDVNDPIAIDKYAFLPYTT